MSQRSGTIGMASLAAEDFNFAANDGDALDVLDLPQLYTRPSARTLLATLAELSSEPPSWENTPYAGTPRSPLSGTATPPQPRRKINSHGLPSYLTKIVSSPLTWIEDEEDRELIWETAAQRLSERSGRTAMGAISRTFAIPISSPSLHESCSESVDKSGEIINITLHEPALTADNLGLKTWASSYLLAKRLSLLKPGLPGLLRESPILELGAGTGLVGITAAAVFSHEVVLTDLPDIIPNLEGNIALNSAVLSSRNATARAAVLDWSAPDLFHLPKDDDSVAPGGGTFQIILAADAVYSSEHPALVVSAISCHLAREDTARAIFAIPIREAFAPEKDEFRERMATTGLCIVAQGEDVGYDDWAASSSSRGDEAELLEIRCWWSVWAWRQT